MINSLLFRINIFICFFVQEKRKRTAEYDKNKENIVSRAYTQKRQISRTTIDSQGKDRKEKRPRQEKTFFVGKHQELDSFHF